MTQRNAVIRILPDRRDLPADPEVSSYPAEIEPSGVHRIEVVREEAAIQNEVIVQKGRQQVLIEQGLEVTHEVSRRSQFRFVRDGFAMVRDEDDDETREVLADINNQLISRRNRISQQVANSIGEQMLDVADEEIKTQDRRGKVRRFVDEWL